MDETAKNKLILILALSTLIFFIVSLGSCNNSRKQRLAWNKEMYLKLDCEEKMSKFTQEKGVFEKKLEEEKAAHQVTKKALAQEQLANQAIKEELQKVTELKKKLEEDLKEALVSGKTKNKK